MTTPLKIQQAIVRATTAGVNAAMDYIAPDLYHHLAVKPEDLNGIDMDAPIGWKSLVQTDYPDHIVTVRCEVRIARRTPSQPCPKCGQTDRGQTGEHPCPDCDLPTTHDDPVIGTKVATDRDASPTACPIPADPVAGSFERPSRIGNFLFLRD